MLAMRAGCCNVTMLHVDVASWFSYLALLNVGVACWLLSVDVAYCGRCVLGVICWRCSMLALHCG